MSFRDLYFSLAMVLAGTAPMHGQALNATMVGTVFDSTESVIPAAKVLLTETNTGIARNATTNDSGNYTFPNLPPGTYSVSVQKEGFKREVRPDVDVTLNSTVRVDLRLQPGSVTETIEVTTSVPILQSDRSDTGRSIDGQLAEDLVLGANRNFQSLLELVPGTDESFVQFSQFRNASSTLQTRVNGQMNQGNSYLIEGVDNNNNSRGNQMVIPPAEAIQTVEISTSNHDPELGHSTGAVTNVMLKSGGNRFHGAVYEGVRNTAFNSRSFFSPSRGHVVYNRFGGNVGGPIRRNRIFFFADYLRSMDYEANLNLATIPSLAYRTGDLSAATTAIYDPATGDPNGSGRTPFAGSVIPASRIHPVSAKILSLLPPPNQPFSEAAPSNNYYAALPYRKNIDSFDAKVDVNVTGGDRLAVRLSYVYPVVYQAPMFGDAGGGPAQGAFQGTGTTRIYSGGINYTKVVTPTLLNEARIGIAYSNNEALPAGFGANYSTNLGIPGVNVDPFTSGMVTINISNFSSPLLGYSASIPWMKADTNIDVVDNWTKTARNHTIKFGADLRRLRSTNVQNQTYGPRGVYNFGVNQTNVPNGRTGIGNAFASFLLSQPASLGRDLNTYSPGLRMWQFSLFGGDRWQVSRRLTVNLGLRWDFYPPASAPYPGGLSNYNPANNTLEVAGVGQVPMNAGLETFYRYFSPRTGVAYRVTNSTVVRAGFGVSYVPPCVGTGSQIYNYPVRANNGYSSPLDNPYTAAVLPGGRAATFDAGFPAPVPVAIPADGIIRNPDPTSVYTYTPRNFKAPHVVSWNFAVQQVLPFRFTLDTVYVGSHGVSIFSLTNLNAGMTVGAGARGRPLYPRITDTNQLYQGFSTSYNALQVKLDRRFSKGLSITTSFTFGKALGFQSGDDGGLLFYIDQRRNYARADFDRAFTYVQSYLYQLPFGNGKTWLRSGIASHLLGGWQLSGMLSVRSGAPLTITANGAGINAPGNTQTANQVAPVRILHGINQDLWFDPSSFSQPVGAVFGNMGRNVIEGPGFWRLNLSLAKRARLSERWTLELRGESYNFTNTPAFSNPSTSITSQTFGRTTGTIGTGAGVTATGGGRWVRVGAKLSF